MNHKMVVSYRQEGGYGATPSCISEAIPDFPLVTIITVVRNGAKYLKCAIESILSQSYKNIEYIIIDGGSTDGSDNVAIDFNARLLRSLPGRAGQMNLGVRNARGRWCWLLHADCQPDPEVMVNLPSYLLSTRLAWGFFQQHRLWHCTPSE